MTKGKSRTSNPEIGRDKARFLEPARQHSEVRRTVKRRLARIEGQIRGIGRMVDEGRYCVDVLTQLAAVQQGVRRVSRELLRDHMAHCVEEAFESGDAEDKRRVSEEIAELMFKYSK